MTSLIERDKIMALLMEAMATGARQNRACAAISLNKRTLQRWQSDKSTGDARPLRVQLPKNKLSFLERKHLLTIVNSDEFGQLPPSQIVPRLADCGQYIASESTFYRVLRAENQLKQRRAERPVKQRHKPRALSATAPNQLVSWDITYLPTLVLGVYFTCICSSIFLAAKSLAGKFMIQKAVNWPATSCAIFACEKKSRRTRWYCIRTTAAR